MTPVRIRVDQKLFLSYLVLISLVVAALSVGADSLLRRHLMRLVEQDLRRELRLDTRLYDSLGELPPDSIADLLGGDAAHNADVVRAVLAGQEGPVRDIVLLNAAAGLVSYELAADPSRVQDAILDRFRSKMAVASQAIDSGAAASKLEEWVAATR